MGNQSTHHFHFTRAGFNIQVLLQNKQRQKHSESPSSVPMALSAACLFHGFLVKRLVLCLHVPQQQQSLPPADTRAADGAACAETKANVSKAKLPEVCRIRNTLKGTSLRLVLSLIPFVTSSTRSRCSVGFIGGRALVCTKNIFLLFSVVLQHSEHESSMSLHQTRLFSLFLCVVLGWNQLLVWSLCKHSDSSACVPAS